MKISPWYRRVIIPVIREGKHFNLESVHGAKTVMQPTDDFIKSISNRVLNKDINAATVFLPAKRFHPDKYSFKDVFEPFFEKTLRSLKQHLNETGLAKKHFPFNNTHLEHFNEGSGRSYLSRLVVSDWHQDANRSASIVGFLYGRKKGIPLKDANLEIAASSVQLAKHFKQPKPSIIALPRRSSEDTAMAIVNNREVFHRGTPFNFSTNPEAYRQHSRIFIGQN